MLRIDNVLHTNIRKILSNLNLLHKSFYVGGFVRDCVIGVPSNDIDIAIEKVTKEDIKALTDIFGVTVGKDFPVFTAHIEGSDGLVKVDIAVTRIERSTGPKHTDFEVKYGEDVSILDDLRRRDLTINSIAVRVANLNEWLDPHNGIADIKNGILRHTSEAFVEDPLRVFRVAKFAARHDNFIVAEETIALMREIKETTRHLSSDRVVKEVIDVFSNSKYPSTFFRVLHDADNLDVWLEHLDKMIDLPHAYDGDVFEHTLDVIDIAKSIDQNNEVLFAALFHDLGKVFTDAASLPVHYGHDNVDQDKLSTIFDNLKVSSAVEKTVRDSIKYHVLLTKVNNLRSSKLLRLVAVLTKNGTLENVINLVNVDRIAKGFGKIDDSIISRIRLAQYVNSIRLPQELVDSFKGKKGHIINRIVEQFRIDNFNLLEGR